MKVQHVSAAGNTGACKKVKYTEGGIFLGTVFTGAAVGAGSGVATGVICAAIGLPTVGVGTLVCGIVVVGVGSFAAGALAGPAGEKLGEFIYEKNK
ncbi:hypothetical protein QN386_03940 [Pseudomonas sp. CCI3.2]|uniref:hypothetical protein n=1 Tax=unclassified Pseudomonas TaxID=196821 RepID=UPI002AC99E15|nr:MULTISPECIES: hypothetical protein [unclassified Pseudomonas]MEB0079093.1 hypothetical protein [Pseudomonas sp. MH10out]MEB0092100.1 hypothetical protein [Pseudomonas sp. CCI4.2]MEB0100475.1 hypothetical protein [Pseudomonas sp. CCI3.2]MEB0132343.1 hypothetical protein [Pseudomonas sp. CCI2.4]MEB0158706.1 hypothetical protein [Pseudomonas sp. AH2 (2023)]